MTVVSNRKQGPSTRRIEVSDGSFFLLPEDSPLLPGLRAHTDVSAALHSLLQEESARHERTLVRLKMLDLLGRREHSGQELTRKLIQRGYDSLLVDEVLREFREAGYVDDYRFARAFIESRLRRRPEGRTVLSARLSRCGVDRHIIDEVLEELLDDQTESDALSRAFDKVKLSTHDPEKQIVRLVRKGFSYAAVRAYIRRRNPDD
ncbi:MAG: regulatory protein RecX [Spirochaetota bacterium]